MSEPKQTKSLDVENYSILTINRCDVYIWAYVEYTCAGIVIDSAVSAHTQNEYTSCSRSGRELIGCWSFVDHRCVLWMVSNRSTARCCKINEVIFFMSHAILVIFGLWAVRM